MIWLWIAFIAFVLLMLTLDLGVFHRKAHVVSAREALAWSAVWLCMGLSFAVFVYFAYDGQWFGLGTLVDAVDGLTNSGATATEKYLTGYVVEKSLSVDNIFVIAMIFVTNLPIAIVLMVAAPSFRDFILMQRLKGIHADVPHQGNGVGGEVATAPRHMPTDHRYECLGRALRLK